MMMMNVYFIYYVLLESQILQMLKGQGLISRKNLPFTVGPDFKVV